MPLIKPQIQPGFISQASQVQAAASWWDGNLVRWRYGFLEKMAGWIRLFQQPFLGLVRRMHAWTDLNDYRNLFVGSDAGLQIAVQKQQYTFTPAQPLGDPQRNTWFLDNLGETGLALQSAGPLQVYKPPITSGAVTTVVGPADPTTTPPTAAFAPQISNGMFVTMPQAQVIVFGSEPIMGSGQIDPLLVRFSDVGVYDVWSATVSNQAGSYRLSRGSKIMGGIQAPQTTLLLTDMDLWSMSYIGPPLVYGFTVMGTGCGMIAPHAIATLGKSTFWLSLKNVWTFGDTGVQPVPCSVWDYIFENLDPINILKCHAAANSVTNEVAFFFPPKSEAMPPHKNLLVQSQDFANGWTLTNVVPDTTLHFESGYVYEPQFVAIGWPDASSSLISWLDRDVQTTPRPSVLAPDGTTTATELRETATTGVREISQMIVKFNEPQLFTFSLYVHDTSTRNVTLGVSAGIGTASVTFDVVNGVMLTDDQTAPFQLISWGAVTDQWADGPSGNGWLRYFMVFKTDDSEQLTLTISLADTQIPGTGYAYIWGAQINESAELSDYVATGASIPQNEATRYVKFNVVEKAWDSGVLSRSAWIDSSIWGTPLGADPKTFLVQQHETGHDDDGNPMQGVFIESGFTELGDGSAMLSIHQVQPDFKWFGYNGEVTVTLKTRNYPGGPDQVIGPFSMTPTTQFFNPRARARYVAMRYDWSPLLGFSARVGAVTYLVKQTGRRP